MAVRNACRENAPNLHEHQELDGLMPRLTEICSLAFVLGFCGIASSASAAEPAQITVITPEEAPPDIFIDLRATPPERFAARELRDALEKMTGRQIAIRTDYWIKEPPTRKFIAVGSSLFTTDINASELSTEQFIIDVSLRRVAIVGGRDRQRGVLYGVYDLLEQLGVRWYRPEPWGEHVPKRDTVVLPLARKTGGVPDYAYRSGLAGGFTRSAECTLDQSEWASLWALRRRLNGADPGSDPRYGGQVSLHFDHIYYQLIPVEEYFDEHPEYFCLIRGERRRVHPDHTGRPGNPTALQLCLSNPGLQELFAQKIISRARGRSDLHQMSFSVTPNDACPFCECDACRAMDNPREPDSMSERVCAFTNIVARKVAQAVPAARLSLNAYSTWTEPPKLIERMEPNVLIHIALINAWADYTKKLDDPEPNWNRTAVNSFQRWKELGVSEIYTYEYWSGYGWQGPLPIARTMADRLRRYREYNIRGVYNETHPAWGPQGLELYMFSKLIWNPDLDVDHELDLYYKNYYGPAETPMRAYHEAWMRAFEQHPHPVFSGGRGMHLLMTPRLIQETGGYIEQAKKLAQGQPLYERRLQGIAAGHQFAAGISEVLQLKKKTGTKTEIAGNRGSFLKSEPAERAFAELLIETQRRAGAEAIFDMQATAPYFWYVDGDVLRNDAFGYQHELDLLSEF